MLQLLRLLRRTLKRQLRFLTEREVDGSGNPFSGLESQLDLLANRGRGVWRFQQESDRLRILAHEAQQKMARVDIRSAGNARLIACEEKNAPGLLCISLVHYTAKDTALTPTIQKQGRNSGRQESNREER